MDGIHAAGLGAGALHAHNGVVRAGGHAAAALDAQALVDMALAVAEADGLFGADFLAGMRQAALAQAGHLDGLFFALIAGELDHVDQRRLIVLFGDHALFQTLAGRDLFVDRAQGQAHGQADTLRDDRSFQEDAAAQRPLLAGDNLVGQLVHQILEIDHIIDFIRHPSHFSEYLTPDVSDRGINASHCVLLSLIRRLGVTSDPVYFLTMRLL